MVAVVAGNGLGLDNSSLTRLGQGFGGRPGIGQAGVGQYVNVANGNLVLRDPGQSLVFDGTSLEMLRTYNSQGQLTGDNGWLFGFGRKVGGLSGTLNTAGSTVTRTGDDGSTVTYAYDPASGNYLSQGQGSTEDTLHWDAATGGWQWIDGATHTVETYDAAGRLASLTSPETGATFAFTWQGNQLAQVVAGDGDTLSLGYDAAGHLTSLAISEVPPGGTDAIIRQQATYTYDDSGRLITVATTLASDTHGAGGTYTTTYAYDGDSDRIASMTQSDGTTVAYSYAQDGDGIFRVSQVITGTGADAQVVTLTYGDGSTKVTDALGHAWTYEFDGAGQLTAVISPEVKGISSRTGYAYGTNGNLVSVTDANGGVTHYAYDTRGNLLSVEDPAGNTVSYAYDEHDNMLSRTVYTQAAQGEPGQPGYLPAAGSQTVHYVYDAADRLAYVIDATGAVTRNVYTTDSSGNTVLSSTFAWRGITYAVGSGGPSLDDLTAWIGSGAVVAATGQGSRIDYTYDIRGQVSSRTAYDAVDANGAGITGPGTAITRTTYDAAGRLLQSTTLRGSLRDVTETESYAYDGMGRIVSSTDALGHTVSYVYLDNNNTIEIIDASGLVTTQVRNSAGTLISVTQSAGTLAHAGETFYDAAGRPIAIVDSQGGIGYTFYDAAGRKVGAVDALGHAVSYTYDANGHLTATVAYATAVDTTGWFGAGGPTNMPATLPPPERSPGDVATLAVFDANGNVIATVAADGTLVINVRDASGNITSSTTYANHLTDAQILALGVSPTLADIQADIVADPADQLSLTAYDDQGRPIATIAPDGNVTINQYDAQGRIASATAYYYSLTPDQLLALGLTPSPDDIKDAVRPSPYDSMAVWVYDASGRIAGTVDLFGNATLYTYVDGHLASTLSHGGIYTQNAMSIAQDPTVDTFKSYGGFNQLYTPGTTTIYGADGRIAATVDYNGEIHEYTYDAQGRVTSTSTAFFMYQADAARLQDNPTLDNLHALLRNSYSYGSVVSVYDDLGRVAATIDPSGKITFTTFDAAGHTVASSVLGYVLSSSQLAQLGSSPSLQDLQAIVTTNGTQNVELHYFDANGNETLSVSSTGMVTSRTYDAAGHLLSQITYSRAINTSSLSHIFTNGVLVPPAQSSVAALATATTGDNRTYNFYDTQGRLVASVTSQMSYQYPYGYTSTPITTFVRWSDDGLSSESFTYYFTMDSAGFLAWAAHPTVEGLVTHAGYQESGAATFKDAQGRTILTYEDYQTTTYQYDANGNLASTRGYYDGLNLSDDGSFQDLDAILGGLSESPFDTITRYFSSSDATGTTNYTVTSDGTIESTRTDLQGHVLATASYESALGPSALSQLAQAPGMDTLTALMEGIAAPTTLQVYDAAGNAIAALADGVLTVTQRNDAGDELSSTAYSHLPSASALRALASSGDIHALDGQLTYNPSDRHAITVRDSNGRPVMTISLDGHVSTWIYDAAGNLIRSIAYATPLDAWTQLSLGTSPSVAQVVAAVTPSSQDAMTLNVYDTAGRIAASIDAHGSVTTMRYDAGGHLTQTLQGFSNLTAHQIAELAFAPTLEGIQFDLNIASHSTSTQNLYDAAGHLAATIDSDGNVTAYSYDGAGNLSTVRTYATPLSAGFGFIPNLAALAAELKPAPGDQVSRYAYDAEGRKVASIDANGILSLTTYSAAGAISTIAFAQPLTPAQLASLGDAPSLAQITRLTGGLVSHSYLDAAGRPVAQRDAQGRMTYTFYDAMDRVAGTVDAAGALTTYTYDANGDIVGTTTYATAIDTSTWVNPIDGSLAIPASLPAATASADDRTTTIIRDAAGQVTATIDASGAVETYFYDGAGRTTSMTVRAGVLSAGQRASLGDAPTLAELDALLPPSGSDRTQRTVYDADGRAVATIDTAGYVTTTRYDALGNAIETRSYATPLNAAQLAAVTAATSGVQILAEVVTSPDDLVVHSYYDALGQLVGQVDSAGYLTTFIYDEAANTTTSIRHATALADAAIALLSDNETAASLIALLPTDADAQQATDTFDANGELVAHVDPTGVLTTYTYDASGHQTGWSTTDAWGTYGGTATYDAFGHLVSTANGEGEASTSVWDASGRLSSTTDAAGNTTWYYYDAAGRVAYEMEGRVGPDGVRNARGAVTSFTYNAFGEVASTTKHAGLLQLGGAAVDPFVATADGIAATLALVPNSELAVDETTQFSYDGAGRILATTDGDGYVTRYTYDAFGELVSEDRDVATGVVDTTTFTYDARGELVATTEAAGTQLARQTTETFDAFGRVATVTDAMGHVTRYSYDRLGRQIAVADVVAGAVRSNGTTYDAFGRVLTQVDALGQVTTFTYDTVAHAVTVTTPEGVAMTTVRDSLGDIVSVMDGAGSTTTYHYDKAGRLVEVSDALGDTDTTTYSQGGTVATTSGDHGDSVVTYDAAGRVLSRTVDPSGANLTTTFSYDGAGRLLTQTAPSGAVTLFEYDGDGNLTRKVDDFGGASVVTSYAYDGEGHVVRSKLGAGAAAVTTTYTYDSLGRLTSSAIDPAGLDLVTSYAYDADDNLVQLTDPDGISTWYIRDEAGEAVYTFTPTGAVGEARAVVTHTVYAADGSAASTTTSVTSTSTDALEALATGTTADNLALGATLFATVDDAAARTTAVVRDTDGRVRFSVDADGMVTETRYDNLGNVSATLRYPTRLDTSGALGADLKAGTATAPELASAIAAAGDSDAVARATFNYYDELGRLRYTAQSIDVDGVRKYLVTGTTYGANGQVATTTTYANALLPSSVDEDADVASVAAALAAANTDSDIRTTQFVYDHAQRLAATIGPDGTASFIVYDNAGRVAGTVDPAGLVVLYTYDALGRLVAQNASYSVFDSSSWLANGELTEDYGSLPTDDDYRTTTTTYDAAGRVSTVTHYLASYYYGGGIGDQVVYGYDGAGRLSATTDSLFDTNYDSSGGSNFDPQARTTRYFMDADGRVTATLDPAGALSVNAYDAAGRIVATTTYATLVPTVKRAATNLADLMPTASAADHTTRWFRDDQGNAIGSIDAAGYLTTYSYDADGRVTGTVRYAQAVTDANRDDLARATAEVASSDSQSTSTVYDAWGRVVSSTNADGTVSRFTYDLTGNLLETTVAYGTDDARTSSFRYNDLGQMVESTDAEGAITTFTYDINARLATTTDALGNRTWYAYDAAGRVLYTVRGEPDEDGVQNARGEVTANTYDAFGDLTSTTKSADHIDLDDTFAGTVQDIENSDWDEDSPYDSDQVVYYDYDGYGDVTRVYSSYDHFVRSNYNGFGELVYQSAGGYSRSLQSTFTYDADGRLIGRDDVDVSGSGGSSGGDGSMRGPLESIQAWTYDAFGNMASHTDGGGATTTYAYDQLGNQVSDSLTVGGKPRVETETYDAFGRELSHTDALGLTTTFTYDDAQRTVVARSPGGLTTTSTRNREGQVVAITDAVGQTTRYTYDANGRLLTSSRPDGKTTASTYDAAGNVTSTTDADGHVITYAYDAAGRVVRQTVDPDGLDLVTTYDYSGAGLLLTVTDPLGNTTDYQHNIDGTLSSMDKTLADGSQDVSYSYYYDGSSSVTVSGSSTSSEYPISNTRTYDGFGHLTSTDEGLTTVYYTYDSAGNVSTSRQDGVTTYYFYDEANELIYKVTPQAGQTDDESNPVRDAVTAYTYDADGHLTSTTQYATMLPDSALDALSSGNPWNAAEVKSSDELPILLPNIIPSPDDRTSYCIYDSQGRLAFEVDAAGTVTETRYDNLGRVDTTIVYPNPVTITSAMAARLGQGNESATDFSTFVASAGNTDGAARVTRYIYDSLGRVVFTISEGDIDGVRVGLVNETVYDADGNVLMRNEHDATLTPAQVSAATLTSMQAWTAAHPDGRAVHTVYDAAGRATFTVDASGSAVRNVYDAAGHVVESTTYAHPVEGLDEWTEASVEAAIAAANPGGADARTTRMAYDSDGNVSEVYAPGSDVPTATYTYDAWHDKTSYTNAAGQTWTYSSWQGVLFAQSGPAVDITDTGASDGIYQDTVQNYVRYEYDGQGRVLYATTYGNYDSTTITYVRDAGGNLIRTENDAHTVFDPSQGGLVDDENWDSQQNAVYNAFNQPTIITDADGNRSYKVYDHAGRLAYDIDAKGYVTAYAYDAYGQLTGTTRYATPVDASTLASWGGTTAPTIAQTQAAVVASTDDRSVTTTYDAFGRKTSVTQSPVAYMAAEGSTGVAAPTTRYTYDIHGDLTSTSVLVSGTAGQPGAAWATSFTFYDKAGRQTTTIDPMGYVSTWAYDGFGEVISQTDYANPISTAGIVAGGDEPAIPTASPQDRVVQTAYDARGRKVSESVLRDYTDAQGNPARGFVTTSYTYDAEGHVATVTQGDRTITTVYDGMGRVTSVTAPAERVLVSNWMQLLAANPSWDLTTDALYTTASVVMTYGYDAFGNKTVQTQSSTAGGPSESTWYMYDADNRLAATVTSANGDLPDWTSSSVVYYTYDANGNHLTSVSQLNDLGGNGTPIIVTTTNTYDADGQLAMTSVVRSNGTDADAVTTNTYDAFGDIVANGNGISTKSTSTYDAAGHLISSVDPKTGVVHSYSYDLAGNLVRDTYHATGGAEVYTQYTRDLDGHVLSQLAPSTNASSGEAASAVSATYDRWGNVLTSTDANGNTTTYTYNERNQVVTTSGPLVNVVDDGGNAVVMAPTKTTSYDADGNVVAVRDENDNLTQTVYNAAGQVIDIIDAAGAHTHVAYDALGNEVAGETGAGADDTTHITFKNVDGQGRVISEGDFQRAADGVSQTATLRQVYVLDEAGNRVIVYDGLGSAAMQAGDTAAAALHANYYSYDSQGRVIRSQDGAQRAASLDNADGSVPPPVAPPRNFDLETGSVGWSVSVDPCVDPTTFPGWTFVDGTAVYNGSRANDIGSDLFSQDRVSVTPGQTINAWADVLSTGDHGGANVFIYWYAADGSFISKTNSDNVQTTEEGRGTNTVSAKAPPGAAFAAIGVNCTNYGYANQVNTVYGVGWDYALPDGQLSPGLDGSIFVNLPHGSFSLQPLNPDFENGDSGWDKAPGWQITQTDNTANGKWVSVYTGTSPQTLVNQNRAPVVPGQKITAHGRISLDKPGGGKPAGALLILWFDKDGNLIRYNSSQVITKGDQGAYDDVTVTDIAPPGAAYATVGLSGNGNGVGAAVFDAISWDYRYIPTLAPGVIADTFTYDRDGNLVAQRNADGDTESWTRDSYGRITDHTDLSGANYHYTYDASSGLQIGETDNWAEVSLAGATVPAYVTGQGGTGNTETRTYTAAGLLASISYADGTSYTYSYDANGNQTRQEATTTDGNGKAVHTVTTTTYDSHNRISQVTSDDGSEVLTETTTYDAVGNRRSIDATVSAGGVQKSHTTSWYAYDADNRVAVVDGDLTNGAIAVAARGTSYALSYDTVGNIVMRLTRSGTRLLGQYNAYDNRGELIRADFASAMDGSNPRGVAETRTYDAGGNVIVDNQYYALGTTATQRYNPKTDPDSPDYIDGAGGTTGANIGGYLSTATVTRYDSFGRVSAEQTFGHDQYWDGTGGDTIPGPIPAEDATSYAGMTLQTAVLYQGPGGSSAYDAMGNIVFYQYRVNSQRLDQYTVTYLKKEGYLEAATSGVNVTNLADVRPATDESYYNVRGERIAIAQHTQYGYGTVADTVRAFAFDGNGQIISRRDGTASGNTIDQGNSPALKNQHYVYVNGQQVAHYDEATTIDVLSQVTAFSNSNGSGDYVVQQGDTLKSIAQAVYGNASLWYIVAQANALNGDADLAVGLSLSIPSVTTTKNDSTTFKPYNPSDIQGSTTPDLPVIAPPPPPPKHHCNVIAAVVIIAVVVVASIFTAGAAAYALSEAAAASAGAVAGAGATVLAGGAVLGLTAGEVALAAAVGGFAGSVAGQLAGDALGTHKGFSLGEALTGGLTAGATAGLGGYLQGTSTFGTIANGVSSLTTAGKVVLAAGSYAAQNVSAELTGQQHHFSWAGTVASAAAAFAPSLLELPSQQDTLSEIGSGASTATQSASSAFVERVASGTVSGVVDREVSRALGDNHTGTWEGIGENALGSAIGASITDAVIARNQQARGYRFDITTGGRGTSTSDPLEAYRPDDFPMLASADWQSTYAAKYGPAGYAAADTAGPSTAAPSLVGDWPQAGPFDGAPGPTIASLYPFGASEAPPAPPLLGPMAAVTLGGVVAAPYDDPFISPVPAKLDAASQADLDMIAADGRVPSHRIDISAFTRLPPLDPVSHRSSSGLPHVPVDLTPTVDVLNRFDPAFRLSVEQRAPLVSPLEREMAPSGAELELDSLGSRTSLLNELVSQRQSALPGSSLDTQLAGSIAALGALDPLTVSRSDVAKATMDWQAAKAREHKRDVANGTVSVGPMPDMTQQRMYEMKEQAARGGIISMTGMGYAMRVDPSNVAGAQAMLNQTASIEDLLAAHVAMREVQNTTAARNAGQSYGSTRSRAGRPSAPSPLGEPGVAAEGTAGALRLPDAVGRSGNVPSTALDPEVRGGAGGVFSKDAPYVIRYDPAYPGRPDPQFSVDSLSFNDPVGYNARGFPRDAGQFWRSWLETNPESISPSNRYLIENYGSLKVSPRVDRMWIEAFPEHGNYNGDVLIHHHVDFGQYTIPVPGQTHVGSGGPWHL